MTAYISYGGGVNSTAMTLLVLTDKRFADLRDGLRIVFADTGAEMPETLCYVRYFGGWLREHYGLEVETVNAGNMLDYCRQYRMVPSMFYRWCTKHFKVKPLNAWAKAAGVAISLIGIDAGEAHRAETMNSHHSATERRFPLIDADMDRAACQRLIAAHGLQMPTKSGCWICPFAPKARWEDLRTYRPDLFEQACVLEESAKNFSRGMTLKHKPMREWICSPGLDFGEPCNVCEVSE